MKYSEIRYGFVCYGTLFLLSSFVANYNEVIVVK
jgi:hypothetical protein